MDWKRDYTYALSIQNDAQFMEYTKVLLEDKSLRKKGIKKGDSFTKVARNGKKGHTQVYLSAAHDIIIWHSTSIFGGRSSLAIKNILDVSEGQGTPNFKAYLRKGARNVDEEALSFSIMTEERSLDLIASSVEAQRVWLRTLQLLLPDGVSRGMENTTSPPEITRRTYFKEQWNRADENRTGLLSHSELTKALGNLNITMSSISLAHMIKKYNHNINASMGQDQFCSLLEDILSQRPEIVLIFNKIKQLNMNQQSPSINADELCAFHSLFQHMRYETEITREDALAEIRRVTEDPTATEIQAPHLALLLDHHSNVVFDPARKLLGIGQSVDQYMSLPVSHYFINSSHNTYLTGHQVKGESSAGMYGRVLQQGCRSVDITCWDADDALGEPVVGHGNAMSTKISFREVVQEVKNWAFAPPANNPYPVILSIEMLCSLKAQNMAHNICLEVLGDMMVRLPQDHTGMDALPSPANLKYKVLIQGRLGRGPNGQPQGGAYYSDDDGDDSSGSFDLEKLPPGHELDARVIHTTKAAHKPSKISPEWSSLVYLVACRFNNVQDLRQPYMMSSFAEGKSKKMVEVREGLIKHNTKHLSCAYPSERRVDSSNLNPIISWANGCQLVKMNFQTVDLSMQLNFGKFEENASCGYVLKPPFMRMTGAKAVPLKLTIAVLSCQRLPNTQQRAVQSLNPYVKLELHGFGSDWQQKQTKVVIDNGFNPVYGAGEGESFELIVREPDTAMLRVAVMHQDAEQDYLIGQICAPVTCLRRGQHLPYNGVTRT